MKGGAEREKEPSPAAPLPSGAGYIKTRRTPPGAGRWRPTSGLPGPLHGQQAGPVPDNAHQAPAPTCRALWWSCPSSTPQGGPRGDPED